MPLVSMVGMPGSGKTTVGRQLALRLSLTFVDTDHLIERRIGQPIRDFFAQRGEERFREIEAKVLEETLARSNGVVATGGGIVLAQRNRELLREHSIPIYLRSTPEELARRLRHDAKRPLLQVADPLRRLRELFGVRDPLYRETAHYIIETGRPAISMLVNLALMQLELAGFVDPYAVPPAVDPSARHPVGSAAIR